MFELNNFDSIQIGVASPEKIREWSYGEVTKPETINYRTQKPEPNGLFCERIFGPTKDWECHCGKYKRIRYKGVICDKCGVEVTRSKVRRDRMGHIELAAPVSHIWYFRGVPSRMGLLLDMSPKQLEQVIYFVNYVVLDPGTTDLYYKQVITDKEYAEKIEQYGEGSFKANMGAEAIKDLLMAIDLDKDSEEMKKILEESNAGQKRAKAVKRLEIIESFRKSGNRPEWMILDVLPVIPPELRPMVQLDGGRFANSDLNDLYRRVINRNNRLKRLMELGAPSIILRNEKRMLQDAVDALIDNGRRGKAVTGPGNRDLKSLSGLLRGKQGRFRQNLLGKRVDYSGRSVIVVGPELKLYQCGLPKEMAIELFKPFVMKKLVENGTCHNIKSAKRTVERMKPVVWDILEDAIKDHPVLLNRAPTLHRLSIQAFEPVLIEGRAIKLHPLVCGPFNADFDGDQMSVHVPLSIEAQAEARFLMLSCNNILKLSDGKPVMSPTQDMVMGSYYLTIVRREEGKKYNEKGMPDENGEVYVPDAYISPDEAVMAYQTKQLTLQDEIYVRKEAIVDGEKITGLIKTTVGRIIFNDAIPQDLGFVERNKPEDYLKLEINYLVGKKDLSKIVAACFKKGGAACAAEVLDKIKALGYKYSTIGAITTSVFDMHIPQAKYDIIKKAEKEVLAVQEEYDFGLKTDFERYKATVEIWTRVTSEVSEELKKGLDTFNPIWMMANSGARGSIDQIKQLAGMRGLMTNPNGEIIEIPVKSCFREGLTVLEYFISSHGGRKGLADTALKTADSGYLTRRLVDVSHNVIVREEDCFASIGETPKGMIVEAITGPKGEIIEKLEDRLIGRFTVKEVKDPATGEVIFPADQMMREDDAKRIVAAGVEQVEIRSVFTCRSKLGVCCKCYGKNMATGEPVQSGEAVGIIAAQSIGEPGTQLTMRTFHTGGIASTGDITQGLPRVEELFEARKPKGVATVSEVAGEVHLEEKDGLRHVIVKTDDGDKDYPIAFSADLKVFEGETIEPGRVLTGGSVNPQDILKTKGVKGVQDYIIDEVQTVYRSQGVDINDKHVEIIVRQMLRKVRIEDAGDTDLLPGELVDIFKFEDENIAALEKGGRPATAKRTLLGITKSALATDSFLSAASFQETSRVLTEAAIRNKIDPLVGLKENVIIGKLIPAGTGVKEYKNVSPQINP
ncbi:MAG: DNA-directed RNA polymerase subunit beta' [Christensenellaceae bacterium]|nr:DNA-directed RNA polymerase subunit beta' [Christensenellaceae bacterium]MDY2851568.1 DNA-directed RNA polymerase subunit beta' [Christensenellaceae bacterium]